MRSQRARSDKYSILWNIKEIWQGFFVVVFLKKKCQKSGFLVTGGNLY